MTRKHWLVVLSAVVALALVACAGGTSGPAPASSAKSEAPAQKSTAPSASAPTASSAKPAASAEPYSPLTYSGADRLQKLEAEAKKEGKLTFYTTLAGDAAGALAAGFKQEYGIEATAFRASEADLITRMAQENQAGRNVVDVIEVSMGATLDLQELGLLQPYYSPTVAKLPKELTMPATGNLVWGANDRVSYVSFAYNKNLIPADAAPKKFEDLLNPALKGKISIGNAATDIGWIGLVLNTLGEARARDFFSKLSAQGVSRETITAASVMELIGQGQKAAHPAILHNHAEQQIEKGAPVAWVPLDNVAVSWVGLALVGKKAPNPNAAALFAEYLLSGNGVKILEKTKYAAGTTKQSFNGWIPWAGMKSSAEYRKNFDAWSELYEKTFSK